MAEGTIKRWTDKGFGFIHVGSDKDLFFHSNSVEGTSCDQLREGQEVTFAEGKGHEVHVQKTCLLPKVVQLFKLQ